MSKLPLKAKYRVAHRHSVVLRRLLRKLLVLALPMLAAAACNHKEGTGLDQNWDEDQQNRWYESSQGSRFMPQSWMEALEQRDSPSLFLADDNIRAFGYQPQTVPWSAARWPRGFVRDIRDDRDFKRTSLRWKVAQSSQEPWIGMNCSACHTADITYQGKTLTVIGGPTNGDLQSFMESLDAAARQTADDPIKFGRFADKVLKSVPAKDLDESRNTLAKALANWVARESQVASLNATDLRYGYGRLDAVGHILNQVQLMTGDTNPPLHPADAPVSYPFLWNVPQQDFLQWNGVAENHRLPGFLLIWGLDVGALGRNTGELIGVFGDVVVVHAPGALVGFSSSLDTRNMVGLEDQLRQLRPPRWPDELFGSPDPEIVKAGSTLFEQKCKRCHQSLDRDDLRTSVKAAMVKVVAEPDPQNPQRIEPAIGTDIWMACNAYYAHGPSGLLQGQGEVAGKGTVGTDDKLVNLLAVDAKQVLLGQKYQVAALTVVGFFGADPTPEPATIPNFQPWLEANGINPSAKVIQERICLSTNDKLLAYKGRSLNGIWATAPYLHNGSVPTLHDLLLPPDSRPKHFTTGATEFDPKNVGFVSQSINANLFRFDTTEPGNSNLGHDYGNKDLSDTQRYALVEYMKTL